MEQHSLQSELRPQVSPSKSADSKGFWITFFTLAAAVYWTLIPIWPVMGSEILGDTSTDAIRGMWGFDHIKRSLFPPNTPIYSTMLNFPAGVIALTLPWTTGILLAPIGILFGPVVAWNLGLAGILLGLGLSTAWLARQLTGSWSVGCICGSFVMTQPMLLHALGDGTPEHLTLWGVLFYSEQLGSLFETSLPSGLCYWVAGNRVGLDSPICHLCCIDWDNVLP